VFLVITHTHTHFAQKLSKHDTHTCPPILYKAIYIKGGPPPEKGSGPKKPEKFMRTNATRAKKMSIFPPPGVPRPLGPPRAPPGPWTPPRGPPRGPPGGWGGRGPPEGGASGGLVAGGPPRPPGGLRGGQGNAQRPRKRVGAQTTPSRLAFCVVYG
jgi:hypothetical protein